ncbi:MAG TPA: DUF3106 domain-containing protein [Rhodocyclaceae bacterium]
MARAHAAIAAVALGLALIQPANAVVPPIKQPSWVELGVEQREILAPLAGEWDQLELSRRKKWLGIADRYPAMKPEEQARIQRRMLDWVKLSPEERKLAREKYRNLQKTSPEHKENLKQKWQEYKDLPEEERLRLQAEATAKGGKAKTAGAARAPSNGQKPPALPLPALSPALQGSTAPPAALPAPAAPPGAPSPAPAAPGAPTIPPALTTPTS